jgi:hypothetical protein
VNADQIKKQREKLQKQLAELAEKEREQTAAKRAKEVEAQKKFKAKNEAPLAAILFKHHAEGFVNLTIESLIEEVKGLLDKEKKTVKVSDPVNPVAPVNPEKIITEEV